ncbi:MAG: hypothetical protein AVDCRST_MAG75-1688, partial [uncultured Propionibacteriaceae bacterium]
GCSGDPGLARGEVQDQRVLERRAGQRPGECSADAERAGTLPAAHQRRAGGTRRRTAASGLGSRQRVAVM